MGTRGHVDGQTLSGVQAALRKTCVNRKFRHSKIISCSFVHLVLANRRRAARTATLHHTLLHLDQPLIQKVFSPLGRPVFINKRRLHKLGDSRRLIVGIKIANWGLGHIN